MMIGQMNNCMNSPNQDNNSNKMEKEIITKNLIVNFIFKDNILEVQGNPKMTIKMLIKNFIVKLCIDNFSGDYVFKGKRIDKDSTETLEEFGISYDDQIFVFEQNDKNQKEKLSKMFSHKHDNITITFIASCGHKTHITVGYERKISEIMKLYSKKIYIGNSIVGKDILFLYNGSQLDPNDNRTIKEFFGESNFIRITVYDLKGIIGA